MITNTLEQPLLTEFRDQNFSLSNEGRYSFEQRPSLRSAFKLLDSIKINSVCNSLSPLRNINSHNIISDVMNMIPSVSLKLCDKEILEDSLKIYFSQHPNYFPDQKEITIRKHLKCLSKCITISFGEKSHKFEYSVLRNRISLMNIKSEEGLYKNNWFSSSLMFGKIEYFDGQTLIGIRQFIPETQSTCLVEGIATFPTRETLIGNFSYIPEMHSVRLKKGIVIHPNKEISSGEFEYNGKTLDMRLIEKNVDNS